MHWTQDWCMWSEYKNASISGYGDSENVSSEQPEIRCDEDRATIIQAQATAQTNKHHQMVCIGI